MWAGRACACQLPCPGRQQLNAFGRHTAWALRLALGAAQVKAWAEDGSAVAQSGHHRARVNCLLAAVAAQTPPAGRPPDQQATPPVLLASGSVDGTIFAWRDAHGTAAIGEAGGTQLKHPQQAKGVTSLLEVEGCLWAGTADGKVLVWGQGADEIGGAWQVCHVFSNHAEQVSCLAAVGRQVLSGSADRTIVCYDAATLDMIYTIPDQGQWEQW